MYEFIHARSFDTTPTKYVQYLRDTWLCASNTLKQPVQNWPRGDSHTISRAIQSECEAAHEDIALEFGEYDACGCLTGYAER